MKIIKHNDYIRVQRNEEILEGFYKGIIDKKLKIDETKIPLEEVRALDFNRPLQEQSISEQIRNFRELLNERNGVDPEYGNHLLPRGKWSLSIKASPYELYRAMLKLANPEMYSEPSGSFGYTDSLMTFHNPKEYDYIKKFLTNHDYEFTEIGEEDYWTEKDHDPNNNSPYPKKVHDEDF